MLKMSPRMSSALCSPLLLFFFLVLFELVITCHAGGGRWKPLHRSVGVSAMHMQLLKNDRVVLYDRSDFGPSPLPLPEHKCPQEQRLKNDCTAHAVEFDVHSNKFRPLTIQTNVWCSSGSVFPNGRLVQTGGDGDGSNVVRIFSPCETCEWEEIKHGLVYRRWYASNHLLPDGRQIIVGGRDQFNYEFFPKTVAPHAYDFPFLAETYYKPEEENNLYPFVHLNVDGNLFIFANNRAVLLDYTKHKVIKTYPVIPGGQPRNYPSTGSSVLLPLRNIHSPDPEAEVLVCGGTPQGAYTEGGKGVFLRALDTCARIKITDPNPAWEMETMPHARLMSDMTLLPNGDVLIVNGGSAGSAGWELGRDPVFEPFLYHPYNEVGARFEVQSPSKIPRMYHSTAILLRDGRVLVGGSNPHAWYNFTGVLFPTDLSLEAFYPEYLDGRFDHQRPRIIAPGSQTMLKYRQNVTVMFEVRGGDAVVDDVAVTMVSPSFATHSFSMNQRLLFLGVGKARRVGGISGMYSVEATAPGTPNLAPPGYYLMFVVHRKVPSVGIWVSIA